MHPTIRFIFMFCLHMWRFVARAVLWKVFAWSAKAALLFSRTSVLSMLASITSTFSCLRSERVHTREFKEAKACEVKEQSIHDAFDGVHAVLNVGH